MFEFTGVEFPQIHTIGDNLYCGDVLPSSRQGGASLVYTTVVAVKDCRLSPE